MNPSSTCQNLAEVIEVFLADEVRDNSSIPTELEAFQMCGPAVCRAVNQMHRRRILNAFGKLPSSIYIGDVTRARGAVNDALTQYKDRAERLENLRTEEKKLIESNDVSSTTAIKGEILSVSEWLDKSAPLQRACEHLEGVLTGCARPLSALSQFQTEPARIRKAIGSWHLEISYHRSKPLMEKAAALIQISDKAVQEIQALQKGVIGPEPAPSGENRSLFQINFKLPAGWNQ